MVKEKFKPGVANISSYLVSFENSDLVDDYFIIHHNLRAQYPVVVVYNNANTVAVPAGVIWLDEDRIKLDLAGSTPISGIWNARVVKD